MIVTILRSHRAGMRGFGLLELLIATAIGCVLLGVLLQFAVSAQTSAGVQSEIADLHQRLRVAVDRHATRHHAGRRRTIAGPGRGLSRARFRRSWPPGSVQPAPIRNCPFARTVSASCTSRTTPHKRSSPADMTSPASPIAIDGTLPAADRPRPAISLRARTSLIYEPVGAGGAHEVFSVSSVDAATNTLTPSAPLSRSYSAQRTCRGCGAADVLPG